MSLKQPWTLIIDDALANSFVAPATDDIKDDKQLTCKSFLHLIKVCVRSFLFRPHLSDYTGYVVVEEAAEVCGSFAFPLLHKPPLIDNRRVRFCSFVNILHH